jgi:hypothetical protein
MTSPISVGPLGPIELCRDGTPVAVARPESAVTSCPAGNPPNEVVSADLLLATSTKARGQRPV